MSLKNLWTRTYSLINSSSATKPIILRIKDFVHRNYRFKQKRRFYSQFAKPGDLCFDVGANVGNRTEVFLDLGCSVVAIEPQPACMSYLKKKFRSNPRVILIDKALDEKTGVADLFECNADAISSMSTEWISAVKSGRYKDFKWNKRIKVSTTTLDELIKTYGMPVFCKIDVEGYELNVLKGLSRPIPYISFEFTPERRNAANECIQYFSSLGRAMFNYSLGESMQLALDKWVEPKHLMELLKTLTDDSGDIYVKFIDGTRK